MGDSRFTHKEGCPQCGSEDNLARYDDGHAHCFSPDCDYWEPASNQAEAGNQKPKRSRMAGSLIREWEYHAIASRSLTEETCRKWRYGVGNYKGKTVQVANYYDDHGNNVSQKVRFRDKGFLSLGVIGEAGLYGQWLWKKGQRKLVIVEGEIDAMSMSQLQGHKWPVVSLRNGAASAEKDITDNIEFVESFEEIILMFDEDEAGHKATEKVAEILSPGKVKVATLPRKDVNELLCHNEGQQAISAMWNAQTRRPDGLISFSEAAKRTSGEPDWGVPWPYSTLTELTYGRHRPSVVYIGAGTGVGKTHLLTEMIEHNYMACGLRTGAFMFETPCDDLIKRLAGLRYNRMFHQPDGDWTPEEFEEARSSIESEDWGMIFDHRGGADWEEIEPKIRYMVLGCGIKDIILDHMTALAAGADDERRFFESFCKEISELADELDCTFYVVSHLSTPDGTPHEEGGRVQIKHFKGSRAIGYWGHFILGLERDQQAEDNVTKRTTTIRVLKDRKTGRGTGQTVDVRFNPDTGRLHELETAQAEDAPSTYGFDTEPDTDF